MITSSLLLSACNKDLAGMAASRGHSNGGGTSCKVSTLNQSQLQTPFERAGSKVLLRARGVGTLSEPVLRRGTRLVATVN
ncbi:MAG TPA: hypothetical protein VFV50_13065, partial [Bdellovibrionales bacterium]|nr:hypothetical protein [Bdellovibrionales bacterium]